jgi:hypothetical protein
MIKQECLKPNATILIKLGSIYVHTKEGLDNKKGHPFDILALKQLLEDEELKEWIKQMDNLALIPKER